jgi:Tfp pilus assembly protein PilP
MTLRLLFLSLLFVNATAASGATEDVSIEEFLQKLSTVPDVTSRRDPFVIPIAPYQLDIGEKNNNATPVLERYAVHQYSVVATLLGDEYPRALIKLPKAEGERVLIVKEKDRLGTNNGVIVGIQKDGLMVRQTQKSPLGVIDTADIFLRIYPGGKKEIKSE